MVGPSCRRLRSTGPATRRSPREIELDLIERRARGEGPDGVAAEPGGLALRLDLLASNGVAAASTLTPDFRAVWKRYRELLETKLRARPRARAHRPDPAAWYTDELPGPGLVDVEALELPLDVPYHRVTGRRAR